jgi:ectoine hydroxylase-related dioxygenase (phytanoyl-CoA dioxygenase family)
VNGDIPRIDPRKDAAWAARGAASLREQGCCVVERVLDDGLIEQVRAAMYRARDGIHAEVGQARLARAGELGVLRLMLRFDPVFFRLLALPEVLAVVDATVSPTAVLHLQNGFILPSMPASSTPRVFQNSFHRDFPRHLNGYVASINTFFAIDAFTRANGATLVVPGSHQRDAAPDPGQIEREAFPVECDAGSMLVFDSTLWHAAGANTSGRDRLAINQQFTRSWIKQQIDYVRALGTEEVLRQPARVQQLLGFYTRVVTSLDEYYQPEESRLYRRGQG